MGIICLKDYLFSTAYYYFSFAKFKRISEASSVIFFDNVFQFSPRIIFKKSSLNFLAFYFNEN